jgi:hypothetical protein
MFDLTGRTALVTGAATGLVNCVTLPVDRGLDSVVSEAFRAFFEQESDVVPRELASPVRHDLGSLWEWLPPRGLCHGHADFEADTA